MTETICLYDSKPYETEFTAKVLSCEQDGDRYKIVLNATQFFPEQGGQTPDRGTLGMQMCWMFRYRTVSFSISQTNP